MDKQVLQLLAQETVTLSNGDCLNSVTVTNTLALTCLGELSNPLQSHFCSDFMVDRTLTLP